jgi:hypothetical protein
MADAELTLDSFRYFVGRLASRNPSDRVRIASGLPAEE